jgi:Hydantoinase/oxoprolinase N-terminal region
LGGLGCAALQFDRQRIKAFPQRGLQLAGAVVLMSEKTKRVCVDVGGTFTDCLVMDESGLLQKFKSSTTPNDPSQGFMEAIKKAARYYGISISDFLGQIEVLVHGTTLATNILLTGRRVFSRWAGTSRHAPSLRRSRRRKAIFPTADRSSQH